MAAVGRAALKERRKTKSSLRQRFVPSIQVSTCSRYPLRSVQTNGSQSAVFWTLGWRQCGYQ